MEYINKKIIQKKHSPLDLMEKVNDKFNSDLGYKTIVNYLYKANSGLFGTTTEEFSNLLQLLEEMKKKMD